MVGKVENNRVLIYTKIMNALKKISHLFCWLVGQALFKPFFHFQVQGQENLKGLESPLIIVFNHSFWLDPIFIMASVPPTSKIVPIHFATWYKHYQKFRPFMVIAGAFPVRKGIGLEKTLKRGLEILKKGGVVGIAPEEKRRHLGRPRKGRRGTAFLALKTNSLLLPIYIDGATGLKTQGFLSKKRKVKVIIGKPFRLPTQSKSKEPKLIEFSNLIIEKIYQLKNV